MFIKVNKRFGKRVKCQIFQFSVVESYRENGKVKHRTLAYLDSIPERFLDLPQWANGFLGTCRYKLKDFPESDKVSLMARLETFAPRAVEAVEEDFDQALWRRRNAWLY
jgi:hypothetical protein